MNKSLAARICALILGICALAPAPRLLAQPDGKEPPRAALLIRCDDIGMCHTVNSAAAQVLDAGLPVSLSVMFACPWYQEAVEMLKGRRNIAVGVHLTLNAEWKNYRWGPVAGRTAVPSLVDGEGYFFPSREALFRNSPSLADVERELRAQIDRALHSGLHIDYLDYHMGTAVETDELKALVERLAREYRLGVSRWLGEEDLGGWYAVPPAAKKDTLLERLAGVKPGPVRLMVFHIGLETPEMKALVDLNSFGLKDVAGHRAAELNALLAPEVLAKVNGGAFRLLTYGDLIREVGVDNLHRPAE